MMQVPQVDGITHEHIQGFAHHKEALKTFIHMFHRQFRVSLIDGHH
jgi:hypothetical protein